MIHILLRQEGHDDGKWISAKSVIVGEHYLLVRRAEADDVAKIELVVNLDAEMQYFYQGSYYEFLEMYAERDAKRSNLTLEDAMALAEYVQEAMRTDTPAGIIFNNEQGEVGICELRTKLTDVLDNVNAAYDAVACNDRADSLQSFNETYDMDFIPTLLDSMVDFGINPLVSPTTAFINTARIIWSETI